MASRRVLRTALATLIAAGLSATVLTGVMPGTAVADPAARIAEVQATLSTLERDAEAASERANAVRDETAGVAAQRDKVRGEVSVRTAELAALRGDIGQLAAASYRSGQIDSALHLLFADDPAAFLARASSLDQISRRQSTALRRVSAAQNRLAQSQLELAQRHGQLQELSTRLAAEQKTLQSKVRQSEQLLASLREEERKRLEAARLAAEARQEAANRASRDARNAGGGGAGGGAGGGGGGGGATPVTPPPTDVPVSGRAGVAVATALAQVGDRYVYAGNGPDAFDCSGLTSFAWRAAGVSLPRSSKAQYAAGRKVSRSDLQPGDLLYFYSPISHVAIYVGGGMMVHASTPRTGVRHVAVMWGDFVGATRP